MRKSQSGSAVSLVMMVVLGLVAVGGIIFGLMANQSKQSINNATAKKISDAVSAAEAEQKIKLQAQFADQQKSPYSVFNGSIAYGSITFNYPKSWSAYVDRTSTGSPIVGYYNPGEIPGANSSSVFAMRVILSSTPYNGVVQQYVGQAKKGTVTATAYLPPKLNGVANAQPGTLIVGTLKQGSASLQGEMLIVPVRDKTLQVYTLSNDYLDDLNNVVLASLNYSP